MSPGVALDWSTMLSTQTTQHDFENLVYMYSGLTDVDENDQSFVHEEFREQLTRSPCGKHEANLLWKPNHSLLPTNDAGIRRRLHSLVRKLKRDGSYDKFNKIIREQLEQGIIKMAPHEQEV